MTLVVLFISLGACTHENYRYTQALETEGVDEGGGNVVEPPDETPEPPPPEKGFQVLNGITVKGLDDKSEPYETRVAFDYDETGHLIGVKETIEKYKDVGGSLLARDKIEYDSNGKVKQVSIYGPGEDGNEKLLKKIKLGYNKFGILSSKETFIGDSQISQKVDYDHKYKEADGPIESFIGESKLSTSIVYILKFNFGSLFPCTIWGNCTDTEEKKEEDGSQITDLIAGLIPANGPWKENVYFNESGFPTKVETTSSGMNMSYADDHLTGVNALYSGGLSIFFNSNLAISYGDDAVPDGASSSQGLPLATKKTISTTRKDGLLTEEVVRQGEKTMEKRVFEYKAMESEPTMPPLYWLAPFRMHSSTLYAGEPEKLFGKFMYIPLEN